MTIIIRLTINSFVNIFQQKVSYYLQVQGELNISGREVCYFVVWSPSEFHYQVIHRDQHFWDVHMYPWLLDFYRYDN